MVAFRKSFLSSRRRASRLGVKSHLDQRVSLEFIWSNDDDDEMVPGNIIGVSIPSEDEEDDKEITNPQNEDWRDNKIDSRRDLEDFARLHINIGGLHDAFKNGNLYLGLKWADTNGTNPSIKLYRATSTADKDTAYLGDVTAAGRQAIELAIIDARFPAYSGGNLQSDHTQIGTGGFFVLPSEQSLLLNDQNSKLRFVFEGCTTGKGQLKLVILKKENGNYTEIGEGPGVWLDIQKPNQFIERFTCGETSGGDVTATTTRHAESGPLFAAPTKDYEKDYILYVHGYNMAPFEKQRWLESTYKRLYWLGYKGRVGGFTWPCTYGTYDQVFFGRSELSAWNAGVRLKEHIESLKSRGYRVHVIAHSQGNVTVAEALRQAGPDSHLIKTYIASQAAVPGHFYDNTLAERTDFSPTTPNVYARYWTWVQDAHLPEKWGSLSPSYLATGYMQGAADNYVNFYNPQDWALMGNGFNIFANNGDQPVWMTFQRIKPLPGYDYVSWGGFREAPTFSMNPKYYAFPDDRFVVFASCAEARSLALGARPTGGVFAGSEVNLNAAPYNFQNQHIYHSGQFRSFYAQRWQYWRQVMINCDLSPRTTP